MNTLRYLSLSIVLTACGTQDDPPSDIVIDVVDETPNNTSTENNLNNAEDELPSKCVQPTATNLESAFLDQSESSGLWDMQTTGTRISVTDFDGDGAADLVLRRVGNTPNVFGADPAERTFWLAKNNGDGTFSDVTETSGFLRQRYSADTGTGRPSEVIVWGDVDNDGDLDAFSGFSPTGSAVEGNEILINNGDGEFELYPLGSEFHRRGEYLTVSSASFTDINRDGLLDLWITHGLGDTSGQDALYIQQTDGTFVNETAEYGLLTTAWETLGDLNDAKSHTNSWSGAATDLNGDGTPDLLSASYGRAPNHLWLSADQSFENRSVESGYAYDANLDWSSNHSARCFCSGSRATAGCASVPEPLFSCQSTRGWTHEYDTQPFRLGGNSGTTAIADLDNDGDLDLLTNEIVHFDVGANSDPSELLFNDGSGMFSRPGNETTGLTRPHPTGAWDDGDITSALFDFDNDGRIDVLISSTDYPGTRAWLWHQQPDGSFTRLTDAIEHSSSHGVAVADFDQDGDLDVVLGHSPNRCSSGDHCYPSGERFTRYFENTVGQENNWLQIRLEGTESNRSAVGAQITLSYSDGSKQVHEIGGGHGHYGMQHDMVAHFGLGSDCEVEVSVRWPDGELTTETATLSAGYRWSWTQGEPPTPTR